MVVAPLEKTERSVKRHLSDRFVYALKQDITSEKASIYGWWMICWQAVPQVLPPAHCFAAFTHVPSLW